MGAKDECSNGSSVQNVCIRKSKEMSKDERQDVVVLQLVNKIGVDQARSLATAAPRAERVPSRQTVAHVLSKETRRK